jgi:GntR family transcriptional regulator
VPKTGRREDNRVARYEEVAEHFREGIRSGRYPIGSKLPKLTDIRDEYHVSITTARKVIETLKSEGLVEAIRSRGTVVLGLPGIRRMVTRNRAMWRDEAGYYSGPEVQHWARIAGTKTEVKDHRVPPEIADLLQIAAGAGLKTRWHAVGDPDDATARQTSESWLHPELVRRLPIVAEARTGDGGLYDRIEEWASQPIRWFELYMAHSPEPKERELLLLPPGVPVLRILRPSTITIDGRDWVCEVADVRMSAAKYAVRQPLERHESASWPVRPAGSDFYTDRRPGANAA